ncbi:MAG TPA: PD-(D/E)XK nuclease-like domain-containing protein [Kofleriaceae bacterium]
MTATLLDIAPDDYHARPAFSSSLAKILLDRSPLHARQARGKLPTKQMDRGTAGHTFLLGKGKRIAPVPFDTYHTKAAKQTRDNYRAAGIVPLLHADYSAAENLAEELHHRLKEEHLKDPRVPAELDGISEQAMEWHEESDSGPVLCKGLMDHVWLARGLILDLKIVEDASPASIERSAENLGYAIQAAAYTSGLSKVLPQLAGRVKFLFLFVEWDPPYAMNIVEPDGMFRELGERRWRRAVETWGRCLKTGDWPAYGTGIHRISPPTWALSREGYSL